MASPGPLAGTRTPPRRSAVLASLRVLRRVYVSVSSLPPDPSQDTWCSPLVLLCFGTVLYDFRMAHVPFSWAVPNPGALTPAQMLVVRGNDPHMIVPPNHVLRALRPNAPYAAVAAVPGAQSLPHSNVMACLGGALALPAAGALGPQPALLHIPTPTKLDAVVLRLVAEGFPVVRGLSQPQCATIASGRSPQGRHPTPITTCCRLMCWHARPSRPPLQPVTRIL